MNEVVDLCLENVARLQGTPADVRADWFARAKQLITTSDALDNETLASQASTAALDELFGLGFGYHDRFADRINGVSLDAVRSAAATRLRRCVVTDLHAQPGRRDRQGRRADVRPASRRST